MFNSLFEFSEKADWYVKGWCMSGKYKSKPFVVQPIEIIVPRGKGGANETEPSFVQRQLNDKYLI